MAHLYGSIVWTSTFSKLSYLCEHFLCKYVGVYDKALLETLSYYKKVQDGRLIGMCSKNRIVCLVGHLRNELDCSPSKDLFFWSFTPFQPYSVTCNLWFWLWQFSLIVCQFLEMVMIYKFYVAFFGFNIIYQSCSRVFKASYVNLTQVLISFHLEPYNMYAKCFFLLLFLEFFQGAW